MDGNRFVHDVGRAATRERVEIKRRAPRIPQRTRMPILDQAQQAITV
jgi:hypothetical protein